MAAFSTKVRAKAVASGVISSNSIPSKMSNQTGFGHECVLRGLEIGNYKLGKQKPPTLIVRAGGFPVKEPLVSLRIIPTARTLGTASGITTSDDPVEMGMHLVCSALSQKLVGR